MRSYHLQMEIVLLLLLPSVFYFIFLPKRPGQDSHTVMTRSGDKCLTWSRCKPGDGGPSLSLPPSASRVSPLKRSSACDAPPLRAHGCMLCPVTPYLHLGDSPCLLCSGHAGPPTDPKPLQLLVFSLLCFFPRFLHVLFPYFLWVSGSRIFWSRDKFVLLPLIDGDPTSGKMEQIYFPYSS